MGRNLGLALAAIALITTSCQKKSSDASTATPKSLYVSSGVCTSGVGVTTYTAATASRAVTKWDTETGVFQDTVIDWNVATGFANSLPQQVIDEGSSLLVLAENATTMTERKIYRVQKSNLGVFETVVPQTYSTTPAAAATHINRNFKVDSRGMFTINRATSIERANALGAMIPGPTAAATSYIYPNAAAAPCVNAAQLTTGTVTAAGTYVGINDIALLDPAFGDTSGKIIFAEAGSATANNRLAVVIPAGMTSGTAAHCAGGAQIATTTHTLAPDLGSAAVTFDTSGVSPTSLVLINTPAPATTTAKLIVSYAPSNSGATSQYNTTNLNHAIVMWDVTETSATAVTLNNPIVLYKDDTILVAPSAMAYDADTQSLFVAVGPAARSSNQATANQGYNIEKFTLDISTPKLTRLDNNYKPFIQGTSQTKCISGLTIGD